LLGYQAWLGMQVWWLIDHNPRTTAFMAIRLAEQRQHDPHAQLQHIWRDYGQISMHLKRAVIAAEDAKFASHDGFDWDGIRHAFERNLEQGRIVAGGSTITQQLAKNLFLSGSRNPLRKAQEAMVTLMLEGLLEKRRLLELYLNIVEWGHGVFGAEAAARHYHGVSAAALNAEQAARLASMLPRPRYYDDHRDSRALRNKTEIMLQRMPQVRVP
jgi:monofunctional biosynthetic peptidoglycan transglycosylase